MGARALIHSQRSNRMACISSRDGHHLYLSWLRFPIHGNLFERESKFREDFPPRIPDHRSRNSFLRTHIMKLRDALEMLLLSAVWGASFILIKLAGIDLPAVWVAFGRLTFGSLFLWTVLKLGHHKLPPLKLIGALLAVGILNNALPSCFFAWGEQTVPSSIAAIINATTPIWALLFGLALGTAHATRLTATGVVLGFLGVLAVVYGHSSATTTTGSQGFVFGVILIAIASLSYGAGAVAAKRWLHGVEPVVIAT